MNNVARDGSIDLSKKRRVEATQKQISRTKLVAGDVLFNATNSPDLVGKTMLFPGLDETVVFSNHFVRLRPTDDVLDGSYLARWLQREFERGFFRSKCKQWVNQATFGKDWLLKLQIPLPPIEEQRRIAAILDAADALRAKRRQALAKLDTLTQAIFIDMFGDPVRNENAWDTAALSEIVQPGKGSLKRGPFGGALKKEIFVTEGFKVYEQQHVIQDDFGLGRYFIGSSDFERLHAFEVSPGDLLVSCSGTIGRIAEVPNNAEPGVMNQALLKIRLDNDVILNEFFLSLWRTESFGRSVLGMTHGTGLKNMRSMKDLKKVQFPLPPIQRQADFLRAVRTASTTAEHFYSSNAVFDDLFASIQQRAFRGEL